MRLLLDTHAFLWYITMLICQALRHELTVVTNDEMFRRYPIAVLSA
jgi:PIN domain nuclease of toxin-antitoxin system